MSEKRVKFIDYKEPVSSSVRRSVLKKGFGIATTDGYSTELVESSDIGAIGILYRYPDSSLFCSIIGMSRDFLGVLYFTDEKHGANSQNWVLEMYGRKYEDLIKKLAGELAQEFGVSITIRLLSECSCEEQKLFLGFL